MIVMATEELKNIYICFILYHLWLVVKIKFFFFLHSAIWYSRLWSHKQNSLSLGEIGLQWCMGYTFVFISWVSSISPSGDSKGCRASQLRTHMDMDIHHSASFMWNILIGEDGAEFVFHRCGKGDSRFFCPNSYIWVLSSTCICKGLISLIMHVTEL